MTSEQGPGRGSDGGVTGPEPVPGLPADATADPNPDSTAPDPTAPDPTGQEPTGELAAQAAAEPERPTRRPGRMAYQDENTVPREPTLAEQRAHQQAERKAVEDEEARLAEEARARKKRKRLMIGGGAAAGVAALIAIGYATSSSAPAEVEAKCVDEQTNQVVDDSNCVQPAASASGQSYGGGFYPIFLGGFGRQYHYNYGGSGGVGQTVSGGSTVLPKDATVKSSSGRVIQRGGFGVSKASGGSSSSGSRSGASSGS